MNDLESAYDDLLQSEPVEKIFDILEARHKAREQSKKDGILRC